ncbi:hypothetical protein F4808DRAFT_461980 [Astrocystis sublimbata]|nr:hypothetical protein F4808DRAFT_461980 [Astrocystis sublimbata]
MEFGTAEEDAFRRDATVNAMFFHLEKQEVVDFTGRGLIDLDAIIMRTPLDPRQTFMDDPLRVLRLIRVGSRLGFALDPEAARCMKDDEIRRVLGTMITCDKVRGATWSTQATYVLLAQAVYEPRTSTTSATSVYGSSMNESLLDQVDGQIEDAKAWLLGQQENLGIPFESKKLSGMINESHKPMLSESPG